MAELIKVNKKVINDPLFTPVVKFLQDRIAKLEVTGPVDELALSKQRYNGLVAGDLVIESAVTFPDGTVRVCIVSRKTGFARVDIDITQVGMHDILTDFAVPLVEINDTDHLKDYVKSLVIPVNPTLLYLKSKETYGVLITQEQTKTHEGTMKAFGDLFFENYTIQRDSENSIDWESLECGTVTITDPSFGRGIYPLFVYEQVLSEAQLPEITSNLPTSITSRRGEPFTIPNTYTFAGVQDITTIATVNLSTKMGYAILERSSDLLEIDGKTIYGSVSKDFSDEIIVRVSHDWNGRLVHKNFHIQLLIEKDLPNDLTVTSVPTDVEVGNGNTVETVLTATYKGKVVEILIPPTVLKSQDNYTNLTYVKTNKDLSMVYRGVANGQFIGDTQKTNALCQGEFNYTDNGTVVKSVGYINITIVRPEILPVFNVSGVTTLIRGYKGDKGSYKPIVKYGDEIIPLTNISVSTGVQGGRELVDITSIDNDAGVNWKIVNDSSTPGTIARDTFTQTYSWTSPTGAYYSKDFVISVQADLDSVITIAPSGEQPRKVKRYQTGGATFDVLVNGVVDNTVIQTLSVDDLKNPGADDIQYIINAKDQPNRWMVIKAGKDQVTYSVDFTFTIRVDDKTRTLHYEQKFIIEKYPSSSSEENIPPVDPSNPSDPSGGVVDGEEGTGNGGPEGPVNEEGKYDPSLPGGEQNPNSPGNGDGPYNTNITAVPTSFTMAGISDKTYQMSFKIFKDVNDITADTKILDKYTIVPELVTIKSIEYRATDNSYVLNYYKDKSGKSQGGIFIAEKSATDPVDKKNIARLWLNADIKQKTILKIIKPPSSITLNVDEIKPLPVLVEFSGKPIALNDPNLVIAVKPNSGQTLYTRIASIDENAINFINDTWLQIGGKYSENVSVSFTYTDSTTGTSYTQTLSLASDTIYPPMKVVYDGPQSIDGKIWDTGSFPVRLVAGNKDWSSAIISTVATTGSNYVSINGLKWEVVYADKIPTSQIVGFKIFYTVGTTINQSLSADFKFNLAAWDGVTFIADSHTPNTLIANSGDTGEITASFLYKGNVVTDKVTLVLSKSTIPSTVILGNPNYDASRKLLVIPYSLTKGGNGKMKLVFSEDNSFTITTSVNIETVVAWPDDLNIVSQGTNIRGYYQDVVEYPLTINVSGIAIDLNDPNLEITLNSGDGDPIILKEVLADKLNVALVKGGVQGTSYSYTVKLELKYTNKSTSKVYTKSLSVPATIRISTVTIDKNPEITANVFDHGVIPITLADERGRDVPIISYGVSGAGSNVTFNDPNLWYVNKGLTTGSAVGELPLRLGYNMGGNTYTIDVSEKFTINIWDGKYYHATTSTTRLVGNAGDTGSISVEFDYIGWPALNSTLDLTRSTIPDNVNIGSLDKNGNVNYTLSGQDDTDLALCFVRPNPATPQIEDIDFAYIRLPVSTKSSNLPFTLVSNDDAITLGWGESGTLNVKLKYGDHDVPANTPGLKFALAEAEHHGITITGTNKDGVVVTASRSDVAGKTTLYPENITVSYEVGAPDPKKVSFDINATVNMGQASINKNDTINVSVWNTGSFPQLVSFNGKDLTSIDHFEIRDHGDNKYVEVTSSKAYEIIGSEPTTSTQSIPMTVYYKVDSTSDLQKLDFDASFTIAGSTSARFKVTASPTKLEGSLNNDVSVSVTPIYKDKNVAGNAKFKPDLSTIPAQLTLKEYKVIGDSYIITFTGAKAGTGKLTLVFWSPDAGTNPKSRDVASSDVNVQVMGELGLEIGNRDNLITGKNGDKGVYGFQILFGGIPIDAAGSIANKTLTAVRENGLANSTNANILNVDSWGSDTFNYTLAGCVQPNATVNVSDFINLSYTYGGNKYTARVEIPLEYTSSVPVFGSWPSTPLQVFSSGNLRPSAICNGIDITAGIASISSHGDVDDTYISLSGGSKTYEVIWGEKTQITHNVSSRIIGQYRNWPWEAVVDIPLTIAAWDQKTWKPVYSLTTWDGYLGLAGSVTTFNTLSAIYKAHKYTFAGNTNYFDPDHSDLKGLVKVDYTVGSNSDTQTYSLTASEPGKQTLSLAWRRKEGDVPGVLDKDYGITTVDVNIHQNSLIGSSDGISGGNGDKVTGGLVIRLGYYNNQIQNNDSNLVIKTVDEKVMKIISLAESTITVQITSPYTQPDGPVKVPMTFAYTDPTTGYVTSGTFDYPVTLKRPADWPVVTQTAPWVFSKLYDYGPNPFKITIDGKDVSSQAIPISCVDNDPGTGTPITSNYMQLSLDQPVVGTWWWITKKNYSYSQQLRKTKWKISIPYRGDTIIVDGYFTYNRAGDGSSALPEFQGTSPSNSFMVNIGDQIEVPFKLLWRGYKYAKGVFKPDLSGNSTDKFSDNFKVISQRYDDPTGMTYLKIEALKAYQGSMAFIWDKADPASFPVEGVDRVSVSINFYNLIIAPIAKTWNIWDTARFDALVSIKDGNKEISTNCSVINIDNDLLHSYTSGENPIIQAYSDKAIDEQTVNIAFSVQLPSAYGNRVIKVVLAEKFNAYDGNEFVLVPFGNRDAYPRPLGTLTGLDAYQITRRGENVATNSAYINMSTVDYVALNGPGFTLVSYGTSGGANIWEAVYRKTGDQFVGTVKHPIHYTGPGHDMWPKGTLGKNYIEYPQKATFYENELRIYPDDKAPDAVPGVFNSTITVPIKFSIGTNIDATILLANQYGMTISIIDSAVLGLVSYVGKSETGFTLRINYDNRGDDVTLDVLMRASFYGNVIQHPVDSSRTWTQKIIIKGSGKGNTITATNVNSPSVSIWDVGGLPFSIINNGMTVSSNQYKSITIDDNGYIRRPETSPDLNSNVWECYNADKIDTQHTAKFTVVFNDGYRDVTFSQDILFNIAAHTTPDMTVTQLYKGVYSKGLDVEVNGQGMLYLSGTYRNKPMTSNQLDRNSSTGKFGVWYSKTKLPGISYLNFIASQTNNAVTPPVVYAQHQILPVAQDMEKVQQGILYFGLLNKENDPNAIENKDYVKVVVPVYVYNNKRLYVDSHDATISGSYGDGTGNGTTARLNYSIRLGIDTVQNNVGGNATIGSAVTDPNLLFVGYGSNTGYQPVWFLKELTSAPQKTTKVKFTVNPTADPSLQSSFYVDVTQISTGNYPTVGNLHTVEVNLNQSGGLPFTLTDADGKDVTSQATITTISANDYIRLENGKWFCYNTRTGDTTIKLTISYSITYSGKDLLIDQDVDYVVKGYSDSPSTSDIKVINGNVWDKGNAIPFTINVSGIPVPSSWITGVQGSATNGRISVIDLTTPWKIIAGDTTKAVADTVTYKVTVFNGYQTWTVTQDVIFNISKYDGVEYKLKVITGESGNESMQAAFFNYNANSASNIYFQAIYRGDIVPKPVNISYYLGDGMATGAGPYNQDGRVAYSVIPSGASPNSVSNITVTIKRSSNVADTVKATVTVPIYLTNGTGQIFVDEHTTKSLIGKYGNSYPVNLYMFKYDTPSGTRFTDLSSGDTTIEFSPSNIIEVVPNSVTAYGYRVRFLKAVDSDAIASVMATVTTPTGKATYDISVTQNAGSDQPFIKVTGSMNPIKYGETGQIVLTGTIGSDALAGKVTFVSGSSDSKDLVSFGIPTTGDNGMVIIPVTGVKVGKDNLTIHITVNGATGDVAGKDYLDINVPAEITYALLDESENFQTSGAGHQNTLVTLTQNVILPN